MQAGIGILAEGWLFSLVTMLLWAAVALLYRHAARAGVGLAPLGAALSVLGLLVSTALLAGRLAVIGEALRTWRFLLVMGSAGALNQVAMLLLARSMREGPGASSWTICQSSMAVPFLYSLVFWHETARALQWVGLAAAAVSVVMLGMDRRSSSAPERQAGVGWLGWALASFAANGIAQVLFLVPSHHPEWVGVLPARVWIGQLAAAALFGAVAVASVVGAREKSFRFRSLAVEPCPCPSSWCSGSLPSSRLLTGLPAWACRASPFP